MIDHEPHARPLAADLPPPSGSRPVWMVAVILVLFFGGWWMFQHAR